MFGSEKPGKKSRRQTLRENQERGRMGKRRTEFWTGSAGRDMRRAPRGQDHTTAKHNPLFSATLSLFLIILFCHVIQV